MTTTYKQTHTTYHIPKGNAYQVALGKRKPRPAFELLSDWLGKHTEYRFEPEIQLDFWSPDDVLESDKGRALVDEIGIMGELGQTIAPGGSVAARWWTRKLPFERLFEIVDLTERNKEILTSTMYSSYSVSACANCLFLDGRGEVIRGQNFDANSGLSSSFTIHLCSSSYIRPDFHLPFDNAEDFLAFYELIKYDLPFKARDEYWRLLSYNEKTGKQTFRTLLRKLDDGSGVADPAKREKRPVVDYLSEVTDTIKPILREYGFTKERLNWRRENDRVILVFNIQKSLYSRKVYLETAICIKAISDASRPSIVDCQIRCRLDPLIDERFLDFEVQVDETARSAAFARLLQDNPYGFFTMNGTDEELLAFIRNTGTPMVFGVARTYLGLDP